MIPIMRSNALYPPFDNPAFRRGWTSISTQMPLFYNLRRT